MKRAATMAAAVLVVGACARSSPGGPDGLRVVPLGGEVRLVHDGERVFLEEPAVLSPGDLVGTGPGGRAFVELGVGRRVDLAPRAELLVAGTDRAEVVEGSVLARAGDPGITVQAGDAEIEGRGSVFRVDRGFSVTLAVFRGQADLPGTGMSAVPALRQATIVAGGTVPRGPEPLLVRPDDPWDVEFLGEFIDIGLELADLERGLARQLLAGGGTDTVAAVLGQDLPPAAVDRALGEIRSAAEAVIAAVVSEQAAALNGRPLLEALDQVIDLRLAGAHWIVVLAEWSLAGETLVQDLARLSGLIARFLAPPAAGGVSGGGPGAGLGTGGSDSGGGSGGGGPVGGGSGGGSGGGGGTPPPGGAETAPPPPPQETCPNELECLVGDVVDGLGGPGPPGLP